MDLCVTSWASHPWRTALQLGMGWSVRKSGHALLPGEGDGYVGARSDSIAAI